MTVAMAAVTTATQGLCFVDLKNTAAVWRPGQVWGSILDGSLSLILCLLHWHHWHQLLEAITSSGDRHQLWTCTYPTPFGGQNEVALHCPGQELTPSVYHTPALQA